MDSLGDYIYIIAIVIAGLSTLLKKKKAEPLQESKPVSSKRNWEDVLRDLVPIEEQEERPMQTEPAFEAVQIKKKEDKTTFNEGTSSLRSTKQVSQLISQKKKNAENDTQETSNNPISEYAISNMADARRAFIMSEIFNRKY